MPRRSALAALALAALQALVPGMPSAAEFTILQTNPVRDACLFDSYLTPDPLISDPGGDCDPDSGPVRLPGTATPDALKNRMQENGWQFWHNGRPALGLDGALTYADIHGAAAFDSLNHGRIIRITGPIAEGDTVRLDRLLRDNDLLNCFEAGYCPFNNVLSLDSPGGSLAEGLRLAAYVGDHQFPTLLEPGATCASACSFVFLAGVTQYEGFFHSRRFAHETARLGLHRPTILLDERSYSAEELRAILDLSDFVKSEAVRQFVAARVSLRTLGRMYDTPPEGMYYLSPPELAELATVFQTPLRQVERPNRDGLLALCSQAYAREYGHTSADILSNLVVSDTHFHTNVNYGSFACYGARTEDGLWLFDICRNDDDVDGAGRQCALARCLLGDQYNPEPDCVKADPEGAREFRGWSWNGTFGTAVGASLVDMERMARIALADAYTGLGNDLVKPLGSWVARARTPDAYCGALDWGRGSTTERLQRALSDAGFDPGPVDGRWGGRTAAAVARANIALLGMGEFDLTVKRPSEDLARALSVPRAELDSLRLCGAR